MATFSSQRKGKVYEDLLTLVAVPASVAILTLAVIPVNGVHTSPAILAWVANTVVVHCKI